MAEKKISIIIPCYNVEKYIDRCFESLRNQTIGIDSMELIFINDASADGTLSKLTEYEQQYPESVLVINFTENQRQGTARNVALTYASAPYIGYVDSDDWVEWNMFEKMVDAIEKYDCDFVECGFDYAKDHRHRQPTKPWGSTGFMDLTDASERQQFVKSKVALVMVWDKVFKKSFIEENDIFFPEKTLHEDIFFVYLAFNYARSYYYMDDVLYHYFVNEGGTMQAKNADHQFMKMPVTLFFLQACMERGLFRERARDIEWMFLERYYVYMLWEVFEHFPDRAYETYIEMKDTIYECIPEYSSNPYRKLPGNEFDDMMIKLLDIDLNREELENMRDYMLRTINTKESNDF